MAEIIIEVVKRPAMWFSYEYRRTDWHCEWRLNEFGELLFYQEEDRPVPVSF